MRIARVVACLAMVAVFAQTPVTLASGNPLAGLEGLYNSRTFYRDYERHLSDLAGEYGETGIVRVVSIGKSAEGRDIYDIVVGAEDGNTTVTLNAGHHPDEYINTVLLMGQIEHILHLYAEGGAFDGVSVRQLLSKAQVHFIPLVNPDGLEAFTRYFYTGEMDEGFTVSDMQSGVNAHRVNLNRNYDAGFRPRVQNSGDHPFSEPETQAMRDLHAGIDFDYSVAYHSSGNVIFWNYNQTGEFYDRTLGLAKLLQAETGYALDMQPARRSQYIAGTADFGGYKDWLVANGHAAATIETWGGGMGAGRVPWASFEDIWSRNGDLPLLLVSHFYREKNCLVECEADTVDLCMDGRTYPGELFTYDGRSYIQKVLLETLKRGGDSDNVVRMMKGKRVTVDITDRDRFIMIDSVRYDLLRAIAGNGYTVYWDESTRTVYLEREDIRRGSRTGARGP